MWKAYRDKADAIAAETARKAAARPGGTAGGR